MIVLYAASAFVCSVACGTALEAKSYYTAALFGLAVLVNVLYMVTT